MDGKNEVLGADVMTAVTVAPFMDANALLAMISKILETSLGQWSYESDCIRFGFGT